MLNPTRRTLIFEACNREFCACLKGKYISAELLWRKRDTCYFSQGLLSIRVHWQIMSLETIQSSPEGPVLKRGNLSPESRDTKCFQFRRQAPGRGTQSAFLCSGLPGGQIQIEIHPAESKFLFHFQLHFMTSVLTYIERQRLSAFLVEVSWPNSVGKSMWQLHILGMRKVVWGKQAGKANAFSLCLKHVLRLALPLPPVGLSPSFLNFQGLRFLNYDLGTEKAFT